MRRCAASAPAPVWNSGKFPLGAFTARANGSFASQRSSQRIICTRRLCCGTARPSRPPWRSTRRLRCNPMHRSHVIVIPVQTCQLIPPQHTQHARILQPYNHTDRTHTLQPARPGPDTHVLRCQARAGAAVCAATRTLNHSRTNAHACFGGSCACAMLQLLACCVARPVCRCADPDESVGEPGMMSVRSGEGAGRVTGAMAWV